MNEEKMVTVAAEITAALIQAGHIPPAIHDGVDSSAGHAADLFRAVFKQLTNLDFEM